MNILVTGGAGYIGSVTTRVLLDAGHRVTVLDNLEKGWRAAVDPRATLEVGDVGDRALLDRVLPGCDAVMHLAGLIEVAESQAEPDRYVDANVTRPARMLDAMADHGLSAIVFSSTAAVYGEPESVPLREDAALAPISVYGATKLAFERELERRVAEGGLRAVRFRYFNVAGAWPDGSIGEAHRPESHIVPRVIAAMASGQRTFEVFGGEYPTADGTCIRDYIHVCDLARAHQMALERLGDGGASTVLNLGSGRGCSNLEVVHACANVTGGEVAITIGPPRAGDPAMLVASHDRATAELGWTPERSDLYAMVDDAWRWHASHPHGYLKAEA